MPSVAQIYKGLTGQDAPGRQAGAQVTPWVMNSQMVQPGGGFVARPGASPGSPDGHDFIGDALERGAAVVIANRANTDLSGLQAQVVDLAQAEIDRLEPPLLFLVDDSLAAVQRLAKWWRDQANPDLKVIGITGSVGKTTVKELVSVVLAKRFKTWKSRGNYNSDIGLPLTLLDLPLDTERAVIEMGMTRQGEIRELAALVRPNVGVVTNVGPVHLQQLGSIDRIADAKAELVESLPDDGIAVLNGDDDRVRAMARRTQATVMTYGVRSGYTLWADQIESHGLDGISLRFNRGKEGTFARLPLLGRHSVHAALAAACVGLSQGQAWGEIIAGMKELSEMEVLRIVVVEGINGSTILDDSYNASPDSVMAALNLLSDLDGRKIAVLGDMLELGSYNEEAHKLVARRAANVATLFVAIGEMAEQMAREARTAGLAPDATFATKDQAEVVDWLQQHLQPGDMVLVKGSRALRLDEMVTQLSGSGGEI